MARIYLVIGVHGFHVTMVRGQIVTRVSNPKGGEDNVVMTVDDIYVTRVEKAPKNMTRVRDRIRTIGL